MASDQRHSGKRAFEEAFFYAENRLLSISYEQAIFLLSAFLLFLRPFDGSLRETISVKSD